MCEFVTVVSALYEIVMQQQQLEASDGSDNHELTRALTPCAGPVRVLSRDEISETALVSRASSLPPSYYFELYLSTPHSLLPPCSVWHVNEDGNATDGALLVDGETGLRALSEFTRRAQGVRALGSLALWLRGDFASDFDDALKIDLRMARATVIVPGDATLRLQQALARAIGAREPAVYLVPRDDEFNCAVYSFAPRLHAFLTQRRGDLTAARAASEYLRRVTIASPSLS